jgi:HK97 family phage portal protein
VSGKTEAASTFRSAPLFFCSQQRIRNPFLKILGFEITRAKSAIGPVTFNPPVDSGGGGGWIPILREGFAGAWQRNVVTDKQTLLAFHACWTCVTLIKDDISKLPIKLIQLQPDSGIWEPYTNPAYTPLLLNPNPYQHWGQFCESWILSKLLTGNTYIFKRRDGNNIVRSMYVLDPSRVRPLIADDGSVFYQLGQDLLSGITESVTIPAREIIHDRWNCVFHPLVGVSPLYAAALGAEQGTRIQRNSAAFFANKAAPGGILTAPGHIDEATARHIEDVWSENYSGEGSGSIAVVGDSMSFVPMQMTAVDAQAVEQLRWTAEMVCSVFHVPPYKAGIPTAMRTQGSIEALNIEYYCSALQKLVEDLEAGLDRGLGLAPDVGVELDLDSLFRMDSTTKITSLRAATEASIMAPNEARRKLDLPPVEGGEQPLAQQQYYPLGIMANRQPPEPPGASPATPALPGAAPAAPPVDETPSGPAAEEVTTQSWRPRGRDLELGMRGAGHAVLAEVERVE